MGTYPPPVFAPNPPQHTLAAQITAQPDQGPAGTSVTVRGSAWPPGDLIDLSWNFNYQLTVASVDADNSGNFTTTVVVTRGAPIGITYINAINGAGDVTAQAPFTVTGIVGVDDYPEPLCPPQPLDAITDPWDFYNRECTSFVAWRLNQTYGFIALTNNLTTPPSIVPPRSAHFGNAGEWFTAATTMGIRTDGPPAPGDVAWFASGTAGASGTGHVAWVESVNSDGTITIEDYNWHGNGFYRNGNSDPSAIIPVSDVSKLTFIHFGEWFSNNLQSQKTQQPPVIVSKETFREGVLVFFRLFFTDPNNNAIGFGFRGTKGSGWAEETHPFSSPSYGRMSGSTPVNVGADRPKSISIAIEYPFNLLCGTQSAYKSDVEAWIYDRTGHSITPPVPIHLSCSTQGTPHVAQACTR